MSTATITYPGIDKIKSVTYTQSLGVDPDSVAVRLVPQGTSIASSGTLTLGYTGQTSITLTNCTLDSARTVYNTKGFVTSVVLFDRRHLWVNKAPISGRYNIVRNGERITSTEKTLRELVELLLQAVGEATPDVSNVSNTVYPEVNWFCDEPRLALSALLQEWGYGLALGFGSETVTIHELGTGTALPTDAVMMQSSGVDAATQPEFIRVCFGETVMQARLELEAVALDTDGVLDTLSTVSYAPTAGWETVDPENMEQVEQDHNAAARALALSSVYRVYRVKQFSDGNLVVPESGGATLTEIDQIFPLENRLLETVTTQTGNKVRDKARVYGQAILPENHRGQPKILAGTDIDDELPLDFVVEGERGLIRFYDPVYRVVAGEYKPANIFLECTFSIRDNTNNQYDGYTKDETFDASGSGTHPVKWETERKETTVAYTTGHAKDVASNTTNTAALDTLAGQVATAIAGKFTTVSTETIAYQYPRLSLRLDGLRRQIQHIISDGDDEPGSYTVASSGMEFDRFIRTVADRAILSHNLTQLDQATGRKVLSSRIREAND